jgi:hypothetical protein
LKQYQEPVLSTVELNKFFVKMQNTGTITLNPEIDGSIHSNGSPTDLGTDFSIGDFPDNSTDRGFIGFNISTISSNVQSAVLIINQRSTIGTPYSDLGDLTVDHVDFGGSLDSGDFSGNTLSSNIGTISNNAGIGSKSLDVTPFVQDDIRAGRTTSQFRLRFIPMTDGNSDIDVAVIDSVEVGVSPELRLTLGD